MANPIISTITLAPRVPKGRAIVTVTATDEVTVFITKEVTVYITDTVEVTESIFDTSFITKTATITDISTTTESITTTETQTPTPTPTNPTTTKKETTPLITFIRPIDSSTSLLSLPTPICSTIPAPAHASVAKHLDPFQVLSIVFGVFILFLLALMWFLVRRFYKMYRAERVLRKQMQTEGTEMPAMRVAARDGQAHVVGEE